MERDVVGAAELELIRQALAVRFGTMVSVATIARTLADHGVQLGHPEILVTDAKWRERTSLFTPEDLTFGSLEAATALLEKIEALRQNFEGDKLMQDHLRHSVQQLRDELAVLAAADLENQKLLASEVARWLTVWLQNPAIFPEWLALRRDAPEFRERFPAGPL